MVGGKRVDAKLIAAIVIGGLLPIALHRTWYTAVSLRLRQIGMVRQNYQGNEVLAAGGVFLFGYTTAALLALLALSPWWYGWGGGKQGGLLLAGASAMAFWGWQDDCSREKQVKGFRGHLRTLWREQRMTSGLMKAWGGGSTALLVSLGLNDGWWATLAGAGLLAFSSNLLNLFDLRPARAIKVFWLLVTFAFGVSLPLSMPMQQWVWFVPVFVASMLLFSHDASGRLMLGDTGANYLGFIAGFYLMISVPLPVQTGFLLLFAVLHLLAERVSFTSVIQSVAWLRRFDEWGRPL
jgi:UDP-GlcNAc:undecaprenyl-phosphate GlcNAc-1-phosphate transferase